MLSLISFCSLFHISNSFSFLAFLYFTTYIAFSSFRVDSEQSGSLSCFCLPSFPGSTLGPSIPNLRVSFSFISWISSLVENRPVLLLYTPSLHDFISYFPARCLLLLPPLRLYPSHFHSNCLCSSSHSEWGYLKYRWNTFTLSVTSVHTHKILVAFLQEPYVIAFSMLAQVFQTDLAFHAPGRSPRSLVFDSLWPELLLSPCWFLLGSLQSAIQFLVVFFPPLFWELFSQGRLRRAPFPYRNILLRLIRISVLVYEALYIPFFRPILF